MIIEITGAGFVNKGAQLMLMTVCQVLRERLPDSRLCLPLGLHDFSARSSHQLYLSVNPPTHWTSPRRLARDVVFNAVARTRLAGMLGFVLEKHVDAVVDISGYGFGDKWPIDQTKRFIRRAKAAKRRGKPVIMLPQMLGPFTKPGQAEAFRNLLRFVDLVYAREQESYDFAEPLAVSPDQLRIAPDITISTSAHPVAPESKYYACIVPNSKLLESNPQQKAWGASYLERLVIASKCLLGQGLAVKMILHERGEGDRRLVQTLYEQVGETDCSIFNHPDPLVLKGVLGSARLVVGSRFHSLVSALSMGTPVIALGWAHKYEALLRDFGQAEFIHNPNDSPSQLTELIDDVLRNHHSLAVEITARKLDLSQQNAAMWETVLSMLEVSSASTRQPGSEDLNHTRSVAAPSFTNVAELYNE